MWVARLATMSLVAAAGCNLYFGDGDDEDAGTAVDGDVVPPIDAGVVDGGDGGASFPRPTAPTRASSRVNGVWVDQGAADWSCLNTPSSDQPSTGTIQLGGRVIDFQSGAGVGAAAIVAYSPSTSTGVGMATSSSGAASRGDYAMALQMLPSTSTRYTFVTSAQGYTGTYLLDQYVPPAATASRDLVTISDATMTSLPAFIGLTRTPNSALVIGDIVDCQGRAVSNAVALATRTRSQLDQVAGALSFYFSAGATSLPVRANQAAVSNLDGRFMILDVPPIASGFAVQILGYRTQAELSAGTLTQLAQLWSPAQPGTAVTAVWPPRRN